MTQTELNAENSTACPVCQSDLEDGFYFIEIEGLRAIQRWACASCEATGCDVYNNPVRHVFGE